MWWKLKRIIEALIGCWRIGRWIEDRLRRAIQWFKTERGIKLDLSWSKRIWALRHGFYSDRVVLYGLSRENLANYVPDIDYERLHPINGTFSRLIDGKFGLVFTLKDFPDYLPKTHYYVRDGLAYGLTKELPACKRYEPALVVGLLGPQGKLILKPESGSGGEGVRKLEREFDQWILDGRPCSEQDVFHVLRGLNDHLVCECVQQHEYARHLFPHSTNTIRFITLRDDDTLEPFFVTSFQRVGTSLSQPADNLAAGGLLGAVDLETGELGQFTRWPVTTKLEWFNCHPESGEPLKGVVVPEWTQLKDRVLEVSRSLPFITLMGYDVVVTAEGMKILEINSLPTMLPQIYQPYMQLPAVARFFQKRMPNLRRLGRPEVVAAAPTK